jgi:hypothetical protein
VNLRKDHYRVLVVVVFAGVASKELHVATGGASLSAVSTPRASHIIEYVYGVCTWFESVAGYLVRRSIGRRREQQDWSNLSCTATVQRTGLV